LEIDEKGIRDLVTKVVKNLDLKEQNSSVPFVNINGIFDDINSAVWAAGKAWKEFTDTSLEIRRKMIKAMRDAILSHLDHISKLAVDETGFGRMEDKIKKNRLAAEMTPGVEDLIPFSYTDDHGLTLIENAPYGVIGAITPSTNPTETIINNAIGMLAAGNSVVFNTHPGAKKVSAYVVGLLNDAIIRAGGPENLICTLKEPTISSAQDMMKHPHINLLVITGGPGVVKVAMKMEKKVIAAGPGNPPVVVDETADIEKAGRDIVAGAGFDNNIICICEKEVLVVRSVADKLKEVMRNNGAYELSPEQIKQLTAKILADPGHQGHEGAASREYIGKNASVIADSIGLKIPDDTKILLCEVDKSHPLVWTEQLMPVIPLVRMDNVDEAIDFAVSCEHGFRHTASMHSRNIDKLSKMARMMNCSLFVKNGSNFNGLAFGGAGYTSFTIASPTGEGFTRARQLLLSSPFSLLL